MFAVKGWNIDASSLKPQTEVFKAASEVGKNGEQNGKKRKRDGEQHRESKQKKLKKEKKRQKLAAKNANYSKVENPRWKPRNEAEEAGEEPVNQAQPAVEEAKLTADTEEGAKKSMRKELTKSSKKEQRKSSSDRSESREVVKDAAKEHTKPRIPAALPQTSAGAKLTPMQQAMRQKLISARFRHLNETLYTEASPKALSLFDQNPEMFEDYHSGFRQQVAVWPENPVDNFIATIRARGNAKLPSQKKAFKSKARNSEVAETSSAVDAKGAVLPRTHGTCTIADLGCGDARLARTIKDSGDGQKLQVKVLSFDLHSPSSLVTKADISNIPLADGSVDAAVFCLALMGTNWISFIEEAYRILRWKGELWVAEIKSRFGRVSRAGKPVEHSVGGKRRQAAIKKAQDAKNKELEESNDQQTLAVEVDGIETKHQATDVSAFVDVLRKRGFLLKDGERSIDLSNKMFVKMEFVKASAPTKGKGKAEESVQTVQRFKKTKAKFLDEDEQEMATDDEAQILKPCLYKIR